MSTLKFPVEEKTKVDKVRLSDPHCIYSTPLIEAPRSPNFAEARPLSLVVLVKLIVSLSQSKVGTSLNTCRNLGPFFCQLPFDPSRTEIGEAPQCRRIELVTGMPLEPSTTTP
ncbi:hypothetical protein VP01_1372g1 [Puccinia sorghi]|uniref:Uncharacterized protein n=1 Tax=Puccinia sorghi TaxID=27349 RepID=A0A0L6VLT5_9BASI|nr:hypothetical protein VP01_1372g1 [Puccinia sorghi]